MSADQQICPICQHPKQAAKAGSLTQWISTCQCGLTAPEPDSESERYSPDLCRRCGKRVPRGRSGSLTQWILRSDLCSCDFPAIEELNQSEAPPAEDEPVQIPAPEIYLELDEDILPTERYRPIELLGRGVAGSVYLCRDTVLNKHVAIKSMKSLSPDLLISFQNEARILSRLNHPYIIKVLDFGATAGGAPFMVMEYFKGLSLAKDLEMKGGRMPVSVAIDLTIKILDALSEAHRNQIFHRDLKPSNILVESVEADITIESIRLIDFGVAHISTVSGEVAIYEGQKVIGTPRYMIALISKLERFDRLTLDQSPGFTPAGLQELGRMKRLEFLALRQCNLQDEALKAIQEIKPLVKLNISGNKAITARGIKYLAGRQRSITVVSEGCTGAYIPSVAKGRLLKQDGIELIDVDEDNFDLFGLGQ